MDTNNQEVYEEQSAAPRRKKKKKKGLIIFLIILILVVAGGTGFYFMQRQKPISATEDFLENMRAMNFDGMKIFCRAVTCPLLTMQISPVMLIPHFSKKSMRK